MENKEILDTLKKVKETSKKRNFDQSVDFSMIFKEFDLKAANTKIEEFVVLPFKPKKEVKICAFVDKDLSTQAKEVCDKVIVKEDFPAWKGKKAEIRKVVSEYDYFITQASIMTDVAAVFGKALGSKGKMPNPKSGAIVPPKVDLKIVKTKLEKTVKIMNKKQAKVDVLVGRESMPDSEVAQNIMVVYQAIVNKLPRNDQQVKASYIKLTMGEPQKVGA